VRKNACFNLPSAGFSLLRAGGFCCDLDDIHGDLGTNFLQFFVLKIDITHQFVSDSFLKSYRRPEGVKISN
jgi:hypothetical protein